MLIKIAEKPSKKKVEKYIKFFTRTFNKYLGSTALKLVILYRRAKTTPQINKLLYIQSRFRLKMLCERK